MLNETKIREILADLNEKILNGGNELYVEWEGMNLDMISRYAYKSALLFVLESK